MKKIDVTLSGEISGQVDLEDLMDENLSETDLLAYLERRKIRIKITDLIVDNMRDLRYALHTPILNYPAKTIRSEERIKNLISEIMTWPEFIPMLLDMHYHGDIDIKALNKEVDR